MKKSAVVFARAVNTALLGVLVGSVPGMAADAEAPAGEEWQFAAEIYAWLPTIDNTDQNGHKSKITIDDILKNLEFTAMGLGGARKGKWSFFADAVYMDLAKDTDEFLTQRLQVKEIQLESWVVSPTVGYTVYRDDRHLVDLFAGARYLWVKVGADLRLDLNDSVLKQNRSDTGSGWDGIVGVRGVNRYSPKWSSIYSFSGGTGDSKSTWQANVSLAYRLESFSMSGGWRYLTWNFEDDSPLRDMTINGPFLGAIFRF